MTSRRYWIIFLTWLLLPAISWGQTKGQTTFEFRSAFWINLHHYLFQQALEPAANKSTVSIALAPPHSDAWSRALGYYVETLKGEDLLGRDMEAIKNVLGDTADDAGLQGLSLDAELIEVLEAAAPVYRSRWWPEHDLSNQAWIERLRPIVAEHERDLTEQLSVAYKAEWPEGAIRTDVVFHANWAGAYTTLYPTRITLSSDDRDRRTDEEGLEILFHEASHALIGTIRTAISERTHAIGRRLPRRTLWHAVLFYSTGEIMRRRIPGYTPYAFKFGLWKRAWPNHSRFSRLLGNPIWTAPRSLTPRSKRSSTDWRLILRAGCCQTRINCLREWMRFQGMGVILFTVRSAPVRRSATSHLFGSPPAANSSLSIGVRRRRCRRPQS